MLSDDEEVASHKMDSLLDSIKVDEASQRIHAVETINSAFGDEAIPFLLKTISEGSDSDKHKAAGIMQTMACESVNAMRLISEGAIPLLVSLLATGTLGAKVRAANAIANLGIVPGCAAIIHANGAISAVMPYFTDEFTELSEAGLLVLYNLSSKTETANSVVEAGSIRIFVRYLRDGTKQEKQYAAWGLGNLMRSYKHMVAAEALSALVETAANGETELLRLAVLRILKVLAANSATQPLVIANKAIGSLIRALDQGTLPEKNEALLALTFLCRLNVGGISSVAADEDPIAALVQLLRTGTDEGKGYAAAVLSKASLTEANAGRTARAGAIPLLVDLLSHGQSEATQARAVEALWNVMRDDMSRAAITSDPAVLPMLLYLLKSGGIKTKGLAAGALANMVSNPSVMRSVLDARILPVLVDMMRGRAGDAALAAAAVARGLLFHGIDYQVLGLETLPAVVDLLIYGRVNAQVIAVHCLHMLVVEATRRAPVQQFLTTAPLLPMLERLEICGQQVSKAFLLQQTTNTTGTISPTSNSLCEEQMRAVLRRHGLSKVLVQLLMHEDAEVRKMVQTLQEKLFT